jgi:hypothetical protein
MITFEMFVQRFMSDPLFSADILKGGSARLTALTKEGINNAGILAAIDKVFGVPGPSNTITDLTNLANLMTGGPSIRN